MITIQLPKNFTHWMVRRGFPLQSRLLQGEGKNLNENITGSLVVWWKYNCCDCRKKCFYEEKKSKSFFNNI